MVDLLEQRLDGRQNFFDNDLDTRRIWVKPVGLVELRIARDAFEEERVKLNAIGFH